MRTRLRLIALLAGVVTTLGGLSGPGHAAPEAAGLELVQRVDYPGAGD